MKLIKVECNYKFSCTAKDWKEHKYKCSICVHNKSCKAKDKIDWPKKYKEAGTF